MLLSQTQIKKADPEMLHPGERAPTFPASIRPADPLGSSDVGVGGTPEFLDSLSSALELQGLFRRGHISTEGRPGGQRVIVCPWAPPHPEQKGPEASAPGPGRPLSRRARPPPQPRAPRGRRPPGRRRQRGGAAKKGLICSAFHQQLGGLPRPTGWVPGRLPPSVGRRRDHRAALPSAFLPRECVSDSRRRAGAPRGPPGLPPRPPSRRAGVGAAAGRAVPARRSPSSPRVAAAPALQGALCPERDQDSPAGGQRTRGSQPGHEVRIQGWRDAPGRVGTARSRPRALGIWPLSPVSSLGSSYPHKFQPSHYMVAQWPSSIPLP